MPIWTRKKHEVSDPAFYAPIVANQKKYVREHSHDPEAWLELGRLLEARIDLTRQIVGRTFLLRRFVPIYVLVFSSAISMCTHQILKLPFPSGLSFVYISMLAMTVMVGPWMWSLRYPPSGKKYFKKAIALNPHCGDAYLYLGLIALRRFQKRKAYQLWEKAIELGVNNKKIEHELRSLYEKEFTAFFGKKTQKEIRQQEIIDSQQDEITMLRSKVTSYERRIESLGGKVDQAKWETNHQAKQQAKEMANRIAAVQQAHEDQIADLKQKKESQEEAKELAQRDLMRLNTEIMEAKAALEGQSLGEAATTVENIMGSELWKNLSEETRSYLATAEQIVTVLAGQDENPDYSLVGMELCKALETEINRVLVKPFARNLNGNEQEFLKINQISESNGNPVYFTYLAKVVDQENFPEVTSLTLGQYHFVLKRTVEQEYALEEYQAFLDKISPVLKSVIGRPFLKKLETVTKKYRNTIAHQSAMDKKQYEHLRRLIFSGKKALLKECCKARQLTKQGQSVPSTVKETQKLGAGQYNKKPYAPEKIGLAVKAELGR